MAVRPSLAPLRPPPTWKDQMNPYNESPLIPHNRCTCVDIVTYFDKSMPEIPHYRCQRPGSTLQPTHSLCQHAPPYTRAGVGDFGLRDGYFRVNDKQPSLLINAVQDCPPATGAPARKFRAHRRKNFADRVFSFEKCPSG